MQRQFAHREPTTSYSLSPEHAPRRLPNALQADTPRKPHKKGLGFRVWGLGFSIVASKDVYAQGSDHTAGPAYFRSTGRQDQDQTALGLGFRV